MSRRVCVIDLPGMSRELLRAVPSDSAFGSWLRDKHVIPLTPSWLAVTCSVQATLTTGVAPSRHGIIANGIATFRSPDDQRLIDTSNFADYRRDVSFWEQSNQFVEAPRFWQEKYRTALLFLQNSIPGFVPPLQPAADIVITPKPEHGPDGKITSLLWTDPPELVQQLERLGPFPLMNYWGPLAGIASSRWIAQAAAIVWRELEPQLQLVYVPHLDYDLQRFGPDSPQAIQAVRDLSTALEPLLQTLLDAQAEVVVLSEYGMHRVRRAIQPNLLMHEAGLLATRKSPDGELIDYAISAAFAMCDHQIAHVYVRASAKRPAVDVLEQAGAHVLDRSILDHPRSGDILIEAPSDAWFDYRWWRSADEAPSFARMVDIHRKPGYDPLELFLDPATRGITQDAALVRGSHGVVSPGEAVFVSSVPAKTSTDPLPATAIPALLMSLLES